MSATSQNTAGRDSVRKRHKGYRLDYRPYGKTRELLDRVGDVLDEYADYLPLTVRQILYLLMARIGYPKDGYNRLCEVLVNARRAS